MLLGGRRPLLRGWRLRRERERPRRGRQRLRRYWLRLYSLGVDLDRHRLPRVVLAVFEEREAEPREPPRELHALARQHRARRIEPQATSSRHPLKLAGAALEGNG